MAAEQEFDPEPILRALNDHGVEYVVVGGLAVAAHGVVRATADLDVVVERSWDTPADWPQRLRSSGRRTRPEPHAVDYGGARSARGPEAEHSARGAACPRRGGGRSGFREFGSPEPIRLGDQTVPVANLADVRHMKRAADRPKDRVDLAELDELHGPDEPGVA